MTCNPLRAVAFCAVIIFTLGVCAKCSAEQCQLDSAMRTETESGYVLEPAYFHCLLTEYKAARNLAAQVTLLEKQNALLVQDAERLKAHLELEERATGRAIEALEMAREDAEAADSVWRSPEFGFIVGVIVTGAAVAVTAGVTR